jgi:replicative DNA helicase
LAHEEIFAEIDLVVKETDFCNELNYLLFCVIRNCRRDGETLDKVILAHKLESLNFNLDKYHDNIYEYVENLTFNSSSPESTLQSAQSLVSMRVRRSVIEKCEKTIEYTKSSGGETIDTYISNVDELLNQDVCALDISNQPKNLFGDMEETIEERGNNPIEEIGLTTPFEEWNNYFGGLEAGRIYAIVARPGQGKSSFLNYLLFYTSMINNAPALMLDTEMSFEEVQDRMAAALSGVPTWEIKTGNWRKNSESIERLRELWPKIKNYNYEHMHVGNKSIDELTSMARRWHFSRVGRGNPSIIGLDYIKLTGEKIAQNWAEYQAIGEKIDKIKRLALELGCPIITAMQMNRSGEGDGAEDSTVISASDRLSWYADFVALLKQKSEQDFALDGPGFGTHKLIPIKVRNQGRMAYGHQPFLDRPYPPEGNVRPCRFYINYEIDKFRVVEKHSLRQIVDRATEVYDVDEAPNLNDTNVSI